MSYVPLDGLGAFISPENKDKTAAYFLGIGTMGLLAGMGLGSKSPNKLAFLVGIGALAYGNSISPLVDFRPRPGLQRSIEEAKQKIPSLDRVRAGLPFS